MHKPLNKFSVIPDQGRIFPLFRPSFGHKRISIFGCTGSIGGCALDLVRAHEGAFSVVALSAHSNVRKLADIALEVGAEYAVINDESCYEELCVALAGSSVKAMAGQAGLSEAASIPTDIALSAIVGAAGIQTSLAVLESGTTLALANKESIVCAGDLIKAAAHKHESLILPVDSEHNAIFQVLESHNKSQVAKIVLTASGGPFRGKTREELSTVTNAEALNHPNWSMGSKITIDSATLMNKGLEKIEAFHLFDVAPDDIDILVHPQSVIHGMVAYRDGSVLAQLGSPDMRVPICHCLAWPHRIQGCAEPLDLLAVNTLSFDPPDRETFSCLRLAEEALAARGSAPAILNAANEVAVAAFLEGRIGFLDIARIVEQTLESMTAQGQVVQTFDLEDLLLLDKEARCLARDFF